MISKKIWGFLTFVGVCFLTLPVKAQISQDPFYKSFSYKTATIPSYKEMQKPSSATTSVVMVNPADTLAPVSKYIYGTNSNPYIGNIDKNTKLIGYLNQLSPNIIRLPGGSLSDVFFWNASPGNLPPGVPDSIWDGNTKKWVKNFVWYGKDSWSFPTDGYYNMLKETHSTGMITVNFGYARYGKSAHPIQQAAHYAADWVRYDNGRTKFWEIGNEDGGNWESGYRINTTTNKDGQPEYMSGAEYGKIAKVFIDSMKEAARQVGTTIYIGTQVNVEQPASWDTLNVNWNHEYFANAGNTADFFIQHNYFTSYNQNSTPDQIFNSVTNQFNAVTSYYPRQIKALGAVAKPIAMTEWNIFSTGSKQDCSFINGMHAIMVLGKLAETKYYGEASRWDIGNGYSNGNDMGMFKVENSSSPPVGVPQWNPRPVFFYMYYFQKYFGDHVVQSSVTGNSYVVSYSSSFGSGQLGIVVVNKGTNAQTIQIQLQNYSVGKRYYIYSLTGGADNPPFSQVVNVNGVGPDYATGGPINELDTLKALSAYTQGGIKFNSPAMSVQFILVDHSKQSTAISNPPVPNRPSTFELDQNYPNPFNPTTQIRYQLSKASHVSIKVYNILGEFVTTLVDNNEMPGYHSVQWNGLNSNGSHVSSGIYLYRMIAGSYTKTMKMILLK